MEQLYMLPNLCWQYHACWCSGDFRSQGISRHSVDPKSQNIPSPASKELAWAEAYVIILQIFTWDKYILILIWKYFRLTHDYSKINRLLFWWNDKARN